MRNLVVISSLFVGGSLFLISCVSDRQAVDRHDEEKRLLGTERLVCRTLSVPGSEVGLRIPLSEGLRPLPAGASYTKRKGGATVSARVLRDTLYIDATCDSLQQVVWEYERLLSERQDTRTVSERHTIPSANRSPHGLSSCRFSPYWRLYASVGAGSDT